MVRICLMSWDLELLTTVGVLRFLGRSGGGPHLAVARAFAGVRSRVTYVLLRPSLAGMATAVQWPSAEVAGDVFHSTEAECLPGSRDSPCRPMGIGIIVVDLDTYLAPLTLPSRLRRHLDVCRERRAVRVCRCLVLRRMDSPCPDVELCVRLSSLLRLPILGPRRRVPSTALRGVELVQMPPLTDGPELFQTPPLWRKQEDGCGRDPLCLEAPAQGALASSIR